MEKTFELIWTDLQNRLKPGLIIPNWTVLKGYLGDTMRIQEVEDVEIVVHAPKAKNLQHVSQGEFEQVWEVWPAYKAGRLQRTVLMNLNFHSKYIISILHWLETHQA